MSGKKGKTNKKIDPKTAVETSNTNAQHYKSGDQAQQQGDLPKIPKKKTVCLTRQQQKTLDEATGASTTQPPNEEVMVDMMDASTAYQRELIRVVNII